MRASDDSPVLAWLMRWIARNQVVNDSLVPCIRVPAISEVWWRQARHWNSVW